MQRKRGMCPTLPRLSINIISVLQTVMRGAANALISSGLAAAGYTYVNVDDCWAESRNATGYVQPQLSTFPSGMNGLAAYMHELGLKFGLYTDEGTKTCAGRPGSLGFEAKDAQSYAQWNVDYVKVDNCFNTGTHPRARFPHMRDALNATGRAIFFSMCEWGVQQPGYWAPDVGNSWRTTPDIKDHWISMQYNLGLTEPSYLFAGPGGWNDPDMLEVGNGGMSNDEYTAHFSLWSILKAPLLIGCDLNAMSADTLSTLKNEEIIALNQDALGAAGHRIASAGNLVSVHKTTSEKSAVVADNDFSMTYTAAHSTDTDLAAALVGGYLDSTNVIVAPCATNADSVEASGSRMLRSSSEPGLTGTSWGAQWYTRTHTRRVRALAGASASSTDTSATQVWAMGKNGQLSPSVAKDRCLSLDHCGDYADGNNVSIEPCGEVNPEGDDDGLAKCQGRNIKWVWHATNGTLVSSANGQCLHSAAVLSTPVYGARNALTLPCQGDNNEQWWTWNNSTGELRSASDPMMCLTVFTDVPSRETSVWAAPMDDGSVGVVLYNIALSELPVTVDFEDVGFQLSEQVSIRDLQQHDELGVFRGSFTASVPSHGVVTLRIRSTRSGNISKKV